MKHKAMIIFNSGDIKFFNLRNPNTKFKLRYKVDNEFKNFYYLYKKDKVFNAKLGILSKKFSISIYKHNIPEPVSFDFKQPKIDSTEIASLIDSDLFRMFVASSKKKMFEGNTLMILGIAGILVLGLIILFG